MDKPNNIRPTKLKDFIGQSRIKELLEIIIKASIFRGEQLKHILFYGPAGLGKTTLCNVIASELSAKLHTTTGAVLEKPADILSLLVNLQPGDILFIDEIHRLPIQLEELIYSAMEDGYVDVVIDTTENSKPLRINLVSFTLVAATTKIGSLSRPLQSRFSNLFRLDYYSNAEIKQILENLALKYNVEINDDIKDTIAILGRGIPRLLVNVFFQIRDIAAVTNNNVIDKTVIKKAFNLLGVNDNGINDIELKYLSILINTYQGGPVGVETLALSLNEPVTTIVEICESYLLRQGLIKYTRHGRIALAGAYKLVKDIKNGS